MKHPSMTTRGTHLALVIAAAAAFFLPKRVDCSFPGQSCNVAGPHHSICASHDVEPLGFYGLELVLHRDLGFAYSTEIECR
jgi:hypothetical protein